MVTIAAYPRESLVSDPDSAANEMMRVVRPGGRVSACVWDFDGGMEMLRCFWDAARYADYDELWNGFLAGVGPAGAYCVSLPDDNRQRLRTALFRRLGEPTGSFALGAVARSAVARTPG